MTTWKNNGTAKNNCVKKRFKKGNSQNVTLTPRGIVEYWAKNIGGYFYHPFHHHFVIISYVIIFMLLFSVVYYYICYYFYIIIFYAFIFYFLILLPFFVINNLFFFLKTWHTHQNKSHLVRQNFLWYQTPNVGSRMYATNFYCHSGAHLWLIPS
jgi:hypothetical protein